MKIYAFNENFSNNEWQKYNWQQQTGLMHEKTEFFNR